MNGLHQQTIKSIFLGLISVFLIVAFAACSEDGSLGDPEKNLPKGASNTNKTNNTNNTNNNNNKTSNKTNNETVNKCLPGQTLGKDC